MGMDLSIKISPRKKPKKLSFVFLLLKTNVENKN